MAVAQPARLAPTMTASYAGRSPMMGERESVSDIWSLPSIVTIRPVLYASNYEKQERDQAHRYLLRPDGRPARVRRDDLLRHQAGDGELDPELLAGPAYDRLRGAGPARRRGLPRRQAGGGRPPPAHLRADRPRAGGARRLGGRAERGAAAAARGSDAESLRRRGPRRSGGVAARLASGETGGAAGLPGTGPGERGLRGVGADAGRRHRLRGKDAGA